MRVSVRHPQVSVKLFKNVGRSTLSGGVPVSERFAGQRSEIDLAPFLGEFGSVSVTKSIRDPAGGFSVTLTDKISGRDQDTLYGLIEPMDLIEIRMAGNAYQYSQGSTLPIVMRGFVSDVSRNESMQSNGRPARRVTIRGQDYGKIWQMMQIFMLPSAPEGYNAITSFPFYARFGLDFNTQPVDQFVGQVFDRIVNPYIQEMAGQGTNDAAKTRLQTITKDIRASDGMVTPFAIGPWAGGSIYELLTQHCDIGPWNELYIEDRDAGPYVVYRPNPFMTADSKSFINKQRDDQEPQFVDITRSDIVSMDVKRTDANVANYYWVDNPRLFLNYDPSKLMSYTGSSESFFVRNYGNVNPKLYGTRKMDGHTQLGDVSERYNGNGTPAGSQRDVDESAFISHVNARRQQLIEQNKDNVVFEHGTMRLKGNERIGAGRYLRLAYGNMTSHYYCVSVTHDFLPLQQFATTVQFDRGTGFIDRAQKGGGSQSPYWSELADSQ